MKARSIPLLVILSMLLVYVQYVDAYDVTPQKGALHSVYLPLIEKPKEQWHQTSHGMETGDHLFEVSPNFAEDKTIFSASYMFTAMGPGGAIHRSEDGGITWELIGKELSGSAIISLIISPNYEYDRTLFIQALGLSSPIYKSEDSGDTWTPCDISIQVSGYGGIAVSPDYGNDRTVFVVGDGVYKSSDGGITWNLVYSADYVSFVEISPTYALDSTLIIKTNSGQLYMSIDGGATWDPLTALPSNVERVMISPNFLHDQIIYVALSGDWANRSILYISVNGGQTWSPVQTDPNTPELWGESLQISPNFEFDHTFFVIGTRTNSTRVYKSTNGGGSWQMTGLDEDCAYGFIRISSDYAFDQTVRVGCHDGFYRSLNHGTSWARLSNGTVSAVISDIEFSTNYDSDGTVFAATTCDGIYKSTDWGHNWVSSGTGLSYNNNSCILSLSISPNYAEDHTLFAGGSYEGVYKSIDGGESWTCVFACEFSLESLVREVNISPNYRIDHTVFAGTRGGLFRSKDGGISWSELDPGNFVLDNIYGFTFSPRYLEDHTIFVGTDFLGDGLAKSIDEGDSWSLVFQTIAVGDVIWESSLNPEVFPLIYSHCPGFVCYSENSGGHWACQQQPDGKNVQALAYSRSNNSIFAGKVETGVSTSVDNGNTWEMFNSNLGSLMIYNLKISPTVPSNLFAGTAAGVWQIRLP